MFTSFVGIYRYDLMTLHVDQMITDNYFTFYVLDEKSFQSILFLYVVIG